MDSLEKNQRIERLKDVFTLIHPDLEVKRCSQAKRDNEDRRLRVQTWLTSIVESTSQDENPWRGQDKGRGSVLSLLPQFMQLLRECILMHQWAQVSAMLKQISRIPYGADWATWKATLTTLYTEPESNVSFVQEFFRHCYLLKECNVYDVALEFVQYLISQGLTQEASQAIQTARKSRPGGKSEYQRDLTQHTLTLLDGYQGLIFYVDWKAALNKQLESSQNTLSQSFYDLTSSQGPSDEAIQNIARRATLGLDVLVRKSGVWDIFLTKSVEIHEYYGELDKAKDLLYLYRDRNPDNPNAHRFIYEYFTRNSDHHDEAFANKELLSALKGLAKLDPANPLVLTLWQKMTDGGEVDQALCYVFDLLDYEIWGEKVEGWHCLAKSLGTGLSKARGQEERDSFVTVLTTCWSSRKDWWPQYHFRSCALRNVDQSSSDQLLASKIIAAEVLMGQDCYFNTEARKALNVSSRQLLDNTLSDLDLTTIAEFTEKAADCVTRCPELRKRQSKRSPAVPSSRLSTDNAVTPVSSSSSGRRRHGRVNKGSISVSRTDMVNAGSFEANNSSLTGLGNSSAVDPKCALPSDDVVPQYEAQSSDSLRPSLLSSGSSASIDFSSSSLSSSEADSGDKQHTSRPNRSLVFSRTKKKSVDSGRSEGKSLEKSGLSDMPKLETLESGADTSTQRKKRERRSDDVEDVDFRPCKQRRTNN